MTPNPAADPNPSVEPSLTVEPSPTAEPEPMPNAETGQAKILDPHLIRQDFPILGQSIHRQKPLIYFDSGASSQRPNQVVQAMTKNYETTYANVHRGTHWLSEESSRLYEEARLAVQKFINAAWPEEVIFTAGTTASINTVARSWGDTNVAAGRRNPPNLDGAPFQHRSLAATG